MHLEKLSTTLASALLAVVMLASGCASEGAEGACQNDDDCLFSSADVGKVCQEGSCAFPSAATAPNFCLPVINPASEFFGENRCLSEEKGQVVLLFFALLA
ncbi:MAG: hypothetical protein JRH20_06115 [Deltaproteobacteria bacterium]|nr:hypothetical protein [Deltaproteobacteria bacterium]